jgi:alpha-glucosidase (family GH31 glycosyl hydrolase)
MKIKKYSMMFVICGLLLLGFAGLKLVPITYKEETNEYKNLSYTSQEKVREIIEYNKNLSYTQHIFESCSTKENASAQLLCVNQYVKHNFNYAPREDVYSIDEMFIEGADCKSYAIYYATLADMLGYNYAFFQTSNHIMAIVDFGKGYCILDQELGACFDYQINEQEIKNE